ncbi:hypothetical protein F5X99DRAFT_391215 [Biscogniauxia marginata]|nr:hypothetical protein F5X99DRAFT_391215 [Biscogniauxia marginata]
MCSTAPNHISYNHHSFNVEPSEMAPLCKFWQQGNCRNGANCRFEHPGANSNPFGAPNSNTNRFSALNNGGNRPQENVNPYKITKDGIKVDLADECPTWILSCYGPGRDAPEQLFGGYPREQSLEEVMVYIRGSSDQQQAMTEVAALYQQSQQQIETTLGNLDGAVQFLLAAENSHPNRIDICKQSTREGGTAGVFARDAVQGGYAANPLASNPSANQNPFSSSPQPNPFSGGGSSFGQPSTLGQKPSPFGTAPSSQFGQPSQMGSIPPAFGQPSQIGSAPSAFGQPSALGQRPNPFGAPSSGPAGPSGFGQAGQGAFGQPSALGQRPNPFGAPASSAPNSFGQPTAAAAPSPFAQQATPTSSPFSQPTASNPFAQVASTPNDQSMDTSAPPPAASNPFGQPSSSGFAAPTNGNAFGSQASNFATAGSSNPFGQPQPQSQSQPSAQTATAVKSGPYAPQSTKQHPPPESYINKAMNGRIMSFRGQPVIYKWKVHDKYQDQAPPQDPTNKAVSVPVPGVRNADGSWRKIFFPEGPPGYNKDTEPDASKYDAAVQATYARMAATGRFEGDMPEVPPMREDCVWNF